MPTPLTASDFKLWNPTPEFIQKLNIALLYASQDANLNAMARMVADQHVGIIFNLPGNNIAGIDPKDKGETSFGKMANGEKVILWNPDSGIWVWDSNGSGKNYLNGIQSAADNLLHEMFHGLDPNEVTNHGIPDAQFENVAERIAVGIETAVNQWIGEPTRNNHLGTPINMDNPTIHTITTEDGAFQLTWIDMNGHVQYGPQVSYGELQALHFGKLPPPSPDDAPTYESGSGNPGDPPPIFGVNHEPHDGGFIDPDGGLYEDPGYGPFGGGFEDPLPNFAGADGSGHWVPHAANLWAPVAPHHDDGTVKLIGHLPALEAA
jgi:hypothetical protein